MKHFTAADVEAHQQRNHGGVVCTCGLRPTFLVGHSSTCPKAVLPGYLPREVVAAAGAAGAKQRALPKPVAMTRPEREMGMMLEAQKRAGEIVDYIFQGMSLAYAADPQTGAQLRYKCDYVVIVRTLAQTIEGPKDGPWSQIRIIECKGDGKHAISDAAKLRFKGARAAWPMFKFEMHQRQRDGQWRQVL